MARKDGKRRARGRNVSGRAPAAAQTSWRLPLAALVGGLALVSYINTLTLDFALDDFPYIVRSPKVMGSESPLGLLTHVDDAHLYRPLTMLTYAANATLDPGPAGFHLVNVALHVVVSLLVFRLVDILLGGVEVAAASASLFAVHPIHSEAVTGIVGRAELLAALFGLLSLLALVRAERPTGRAQIGFSLASAAALLGAVLSKESGVTVLGLAVVVVLWLRSSWDPRAVARALAPHVVVLLAFVAWRAWLVGALTRPAPPPFVDNPLAHVGVWPRLGTAVVVLGQYLGLLTAPLRLSSDYSFNQVPVVVSPLDPRLLIAAAVLLALVAVVAIIGRRAGPLALALAFFAIPLGLTANVLFPIGTIKAERLLYMPSIGWCMAAGWLVMKLGRVERPLAFGVVGVVVALFAVRTWTRNGEWKDDATVFEVTVRTAPGSAKAHNNWGFELVRRRQLEAAIRHFRTSVEIAPDWADARANLGSALLRAGRSVDAIGEYERAARLDPSNALIHTGFGLALVQQGNRTEARKEFEMAVRLDPAAVDALYSLGLLSLQMGQALEAAEHFAATVRVNPRHADAYSGWGVALLQQGKSDEAIARLEAALRINPRHAQAQAALRSAQAGRNP